MARQDHCFFFDAPDLTLGVAFCRLDGYSKERARSEVKHILEREGFASFRLSYVGVLNYQDMDADIPGYLHHFKKHDPVWLLVCGSTTQVS